MLWSALRQASNTLAARPRHSAGHIRRPFEAFMGNLLVALGMRLAVE